MNWGTYLFNVSRTCSKSAMQACAFQIYSWWQEGIAPETAAKWATSRAALNAAKEGQ